MIVILDPADVETAQSVVPELRVIGSTTEATGDERVRLV
jgi:hypothetical protein